MIKIFNSYSGFDLSLDAEKTATPIELMHAVLNLEAGIKLLDYVSYLSGNFLDLITPNTPYGDYILVRATQVNEYLLQIAATGVVSNETVYIHLERMSHSLPEEVLASKPAHLEKLEIFLKDALQCNVLYSKEHFKRATDLIINSGWIATNYYAIDSVLRYAEKMNLQISVVSNIAAGTLVVKCFFAKAPTAFIDIPLIPIVSAEDEKSKTYKREKPTAAGPTTQPCNLTKLLDFGKNSKSEVVTWSGLEYDLRLIIKNMLSYTMGMTMQEAMGKMLTPESTVKEYPKTVLLSKGSLKLHREAIRLFVNTLYELKAFGIVDLHRHDGSRAEVLINLNGLPKECKVLFTLVDEIKILITFETLTGSKISDSLMVTRPLNLTFLEYDFNQLVKIRGLADLPECNLRNLVNAYIGIQPTSLSHFMLKSKSEELANDTIDLPHATVSKGSTRYRFYYLDLNHFFLEINMESNGRTLYAFYDDPERLFSRIENLPLSLLALYRTFSILQRK